MSFKLSTTITILLIIVVLLVGCRSVNSQNINADIENVYSSPQPVPPGSRGTRIQPPGSVSPAEELYIEHIGTVLQQHKDLFLAPEDRDGRWSNLQVSQGFITNGNPDTNAQTFFVTHNGYYLGLLMVTYYDGRFISNFGRASFLACLIEFSNENITTIISNNTPIAVIELPSADFFIQTEDNLFHLTSASRNPICFGGDFPEIFDIVHEKAVIVFSDLFTDNETGEQGEVNKGTVLLTFDKIYTTLCLEKQKMTRQLSEEPSPCSFMLDESCNRSGFLEHIRSTGEVIFEA